MRKATAKQYFVRNIFGNAGQILNARQEISRGAGSYGVNWRFSEIDKDEFLEMLNKDEGYVFCIKTLSNKYVEVDKDDIDKYIFE